MRLGKQATELSKQIAELQGKRDADRMRLDLLIRDLKRLLADAEALRGAETTS